MVSNIVTDFGYVDMIDWANIKPWPLRTHLTYDPYTKLTKKDYQRLQKYHKNLSGSFESYLIERCTIQLMLELE